MKIYIPTVHRPDNQITYNKLPESLKEQVVFVVQAWEREQYHYDAEYLVLPDTQEYHYTDYLCLARTREYIYKHARHSKYAVWDDDLTFVRRNQKYWGLESNMEKSKREANHDDIIYMVNMFESWLDEVTVCGCSFVENPPIKKEYDYNASVGSAIFVNGTHFAHEIDDMDLSRVRAGEDTCFNLNLLTRGYANRVSTEFCIRNASVENKHKMASTVWDQQSFDQTHNDHKILAEMFPGIFNILYDESGNRVPGGFRNYGRVKVYWTKAFKQSKIKTTFKDLFQ